mgnify:CR=1 FL=1
MQKARRYKDAKLNLAVEELNKYRELKSRLRYLNNKKEEFEQQYSEIKAVTYDGIKVAGGEYRNRIEDVAIRREDLNLEINRMQVEAERQMLYIQVRLNALTSLHTKVLQLYYVECKSLLDVAREMYYSVDGVRKLKFKALKSYAYS